MSLNRWDAKRDATEPVVVEYLRARGALVIRLSGKDTPDLLCGYAGRWICFEVKSAGGKVSEGQQAFIEAAAHKGLPAYVVRTIDEVAGHLDRLVRLPA